MKAKQNTGTAGRTQTPSITHIPNSEFPFRAPIHFPPLSPPAWFTPFPILVQSITIYSFSSTYLVPLPAGLASTSLSAIFQPFKYPTPALRYVAKPNHPRYGTRAQPATGSTLCGRQGSQLLRFRRGSFGGKEEVRKDLLPPDISQIPCRSSQGNDVNGGFDGPLGDEEERHPEEIEA